MLWAVRTMYGTGIPAWWFWTLDSWEVIVGNPIVQISQFSSTRDGRKPCPNWLLSVDSILASLVMRFYVCQMLVCCYYLNDQELIRWCMNISMPRTKATFRNLEPNRNLFLSFQKKNLVSSSSLYVYGQVHSTQVPTQVPATKPRNIRFELV